jgi:IS5 family transposase
MIPGRFFLDPDHRYQRLNAVGDPLVKLSAIIPLAVFEKALATNRRGDGLSFPRR